MTGATKRARARRGEGELLRAEIMAAAEKLLIKTGDEGAVSIRAIADAAGVTPPSIYLHFADKTELLAAVCEARFQDFDRYLEEAARGVDDPLEALRARGRAYVRFGLENPEHYRILFMTRPGAERPQRELDQLPGMTAFSHLVEDVARAMDAGLLSAGDPFLVATGLWSTVHGITSLLIARPDFPWPDHDRLLDHMLGVAIRGLEPPA
ncbi:MAG TPA: TetR/AcrR family transcriptional regulator [Acidimicrobiales bacterium]|nr:TetR/AcrR family transcriptional regulator [Acidimicrobiales bacterium]